MSLQVATLSDKISDNIPIISRLSSLFAQVGDHALNQKARIDLGFEAVPELRRLGLLGTIIAAKIGTAKGNELADKVESGELS